MTLQPSTRASKALALGVLAGFCMIVWTTIAQPLLQVATSRQADLVTLRTQYDELKSMEQAVPVLSRREQIANQQLHAIGAFWSGASRDKLAIKIQDLIRAATLQGKGTMSSFSVAQGDRGKLSPRIRVQARLEGSMEMLEQVLAAVEASNPKLIVDELSVSALEPATADHPQRLGAEMVVIGYLGLI